MSKSPKAAGKPASGWPVYVPPKRTVIMRAYRYSVVDMTGRDPAGRDPGARFRCGKCGFVSDRFFGMTRSAIARGLPCRTCNG